MDPLDDTLVFHSIVQPHWKPCSGRLEQCVEDLEDDQDEDSNERHEDCDPVDTAQVQKHRYPSLEVKTMIR